MGKTMDALLALQIIEHQLAEVKSKLKTRSAAVHSQQARIDILQTQDKTLHDQMQTRLKEAGAVELELKTREAEISKQRTMLNTAKTNKEYAAVLTAINTMKADNSKLEDQALKLMQAADVVRAQADQVKTQIVAADGSLQQLKQTSTDEISRLEGMLRELQAKRDAAAGEVPAEVLKTFTRIASMRDGDAMAKIEIQGKRPPHDYVCGGCYMAIRAEHANALKTRDDLRFCDCCGRILYLETAAKL
jgi:predicted  nucleic acid-binding Zn-ribbon protein